MLLAAAATERYGNASAAVQVARAGGWVALALHPWIRRVWGRRCGAAAYRASTCPNRACYACACPCAEPAAARRLPFIRKRICAIWPCACSTPVLRRRAVLRC